ncbi:hypothetical protein C4K37_3663 [Pseudomonas chlororaphis subsp. piscium]|nr:hypothetical protein C4K37_3663 [Pseudomonas chlororaphis subsp. piscium]AZC44594.1 hypothetical protein C4K36_3671 [Pseudomonas chlororaphis subsp. piscium]
MSWLQRVRIMSTFWKAILRWMQPFAMAHSSTSLMNGLSQQLMR